MLILSSHCFDHNYLEDFLIFIVVIMLAYAHMNPAAHDCFDHIHMHIWTLCLLILYGSAPY